MKKTEASKHIDKESDDMLSEYRFDYGKAQPNRFAASVEKDHVTVALDPDVAEVFTTSESVNTVLRALISAMPKPVRKKRGQKLSSEQKGV